MIIAVDFDGTCLTDEYPGMGKDIGAVPVLRELVQKGHRLILLTNRSDKELKDAEMWFQAFGIPLFGVNHNPIQWKLYKGPKIYADLYIDDLALGSPMKNDKSISDKPFMDWKKVRKMLIDRNIL